MARVVISGTGLYTPPHSISNEELVASFNLWVDASNRHNLNGIERGDCQPIERSSALFIEKASGIRSRYVVDKDGILDPETMAPRLRQRNDEEPSILCEMGFSAAKGALEQAGRTANDVDLVIVACSNLERPYPAIAIEIQAQLGTGGFAYDMNVACSSATFGLQAAVDAICGGSARGALVISPEICTGHLNFRDRDSHFIFGDAATALYVEAADNAASADQWQVLGTSLKTLYSNNIRNNFGFLNRTHPESRDAVDKLFVQEGRRVFKEVVPVVSDLIIEQLKTHQVAPTQIARTWLHQANLNMNQLIARRVFGDDIEPSSVPVILDEYANTSSAGSIIAFHLHRSDLVSGDLGVICSFGAGYSAGSVLLRKV